MIAGEYSDLSIRASFVEEVEGEVQSGVPVRCMLPGGGGRVYLDRPLPFLCLYRQPDDRIDPGTHRLVTSEAAFVIGTTRREQQAGLRDLVAAVAKLSIARYGTCLVLEIWTASGEGVTDGTRQVPPIPGFRIYARPDQALSSTIASFTEELESIRILKQLAEVQTIQRKSWGASNFRPLLSGTDKVPEGLRSLGLEVQPFFRDDGDDVFPLVLRGLKRQMSRSLKRAFYHFATEQAVESPASYLSLGQRTLSKHVQQVDTALAELAGTYDFLLDVTPVNLDATWSAFKRSKFEKPPVFYYRPLPVDPALVKKKLFSISTSKTEEPTLAGLFREKQIAIDRELSALQDRGTGRFIHHSQILYGEIERKLVRSAREILSGIPPRSRDARGQGYVNAGEFQQLAEREIEYYRAMSSDFSPHVEVRDDLFSGLMVSRGNLLIGRQLRVPLARVAALLAHEVGTHALTYHVGRCQPLKLLSAGLAGYDEFQEGIAVVAEYLAGGLSPPRLRLLAGRVMAVRGLLGGAEFLDTFRMLNGEWKFDQKTAFTIAVRVHRGGGLTKDAIYLRGLLKVMDYLRDGGEFEILLSGKIASSHVPMIKELCLRKILRPLPVRPRYLEDPKAKIRLDELRAGKSAMNLVRGVR